MNAWPRMMKRATAAAYCDLSERAFEREHYAAQMNRRKLSKAAIVKLDAHRRKSA